MKFADVVVPKKRQTSEYTEAVRWYTSKEAPQFDDKMERVQENIKALSRE